MDVLQALQGVLEQVHQAVQHCSSVLGEGGVLAGLTCLPCQLCQAGCTRCMTQAASMDVSYITTKLALFSLPLT